MSANQAKAFVLAGFLGCVVFMESCKRLAACQFPTSYQYKFVCRSLVDSISVQVVTIDRDIIKDSLDNYQSAGYAIETLVYFYPINFCITVRGKKCVEQAEAEGATCHYYLNYTNGCNTTNGGGGSISCE